MSVDVTIGEILDYSHGLEGVAHVPLVLKHTEGSVPCFPGENPATRRANQRHFATWVWFDFLDEVGLAALFEGEGTRALTAAHAEAIRAALAHFRKEHPDARPQYDTTEQDATLARLAWLHWWVDWAYRHCRHPGMSLSM